MSGESTLNEKWTRLNADVTSDAKLAERFQAQPLLVLKEYNIPVRDGSEATELSDAELASAAGGMKYTKGTSNAHVIDARGGQFQILGVTFTRDKSGNISSVNGTSTK
jgi:hypothetical protein